MITWQNMYSNMHCQNSTLLTICADVSVNIGHKVLTL